MRKIELKMTVSIRQLTEDEVEENGEDWPEFKNDAQGAVEAIEPYELAEQIEAHFEDEDFVRELLAGSGMMVGISSVKVT